MRILLAILSLSGFPTALALVGCRGGEQTPPPAPSAPTAAPGAPTSTSASTGLGTQQTAGPFAVTLTASPAPPKTGNVKFSADVKRAGQPVTDATVTLSLSMPSMNMASPAVTLAKTGDHYEGTGNLSMAGESEAKISVTAGSDSGTATYRFTAGQ